METRPLGSSDIRVSLVGIGCNNFGGRIPESAAREVVDTALEAGINFFDTADAYGNRGGSERFLGEVLGARRKQIVLATKFGYSMDDAGTMKGGSRGYITSAVEASLKRLRTDWIDLYQLHFPDPDTPIEETLRALEDLVRKGKVRRIGCSNFSGTQLSESIAAARSAHLGEFITCQNEYSLLAREIEKNLVPAMRSHRVTMLPYYPLASGLLSGKYRHGAALPEGSRLARIAMFSERFLTERNWHKINALEAFAAARGRSLLELAFGWLAAQPVVSSVIAGASSGAQVTANCAAILWRPDPQELDELDRITRD